MADLPSFLFDIGKSGEKRLYFYIGLSGEEEFVFLDFGDKLTHQRCPLDGVYILSYKEDSSTFEKCPACKKYGWDKEILSEKEIKKNIIPYAKSRIERLKEELNHLELILKLSENPENPIKTANLENRAYNEVNLSAKIPEPIIVNKSNAPSRYDLRETNFTKDSRLNNETLNVKETKIIQFKSKQQKEAEERFSHLADHIYPTKPKEDPENSA